VVADSHSAAADPRVTPHLDRANGLKLWQLISVGVDQYQLDPWKQRGIPVANVAGSTSAVALAECAFMLLLMVVKQFPATQEMLRSGLLGWPVAPELQGMTVGIIGFGASGTEFARRAHSFGMQVHAVDVRPISDDEARVAELTWHGNISSLKEMLGRVDAVSLHASLTPSSRHIINAETLKAMRPGAFIVNVARGGLIDQGALTDALRTGHLGGAGLDVFESEPPQLTDPIFALPNVVSLPHVAGVTRGTSRRRMAFVAENIDRVARGVAPLSIVG
jgi:phosphoglycerate dehydrogenase-like enzyme